jgi:hypothetical protein
MPRPVSFFEPAPRHVTPGDDALPRERGIERNDIEKESSTPQPKIDPEGIGNEPLIPISIGNDKKVESPYPSQSPQVDDSPNMSQTLPQSVRIISKTQNGETLNVAAQVHRDNNQHSRPLIVHQQQDMEKKAEMYPSANVSEHRESSPLLVNNVQSPSIPYHPLRKVPSPPQIKVTIGRIEVKAIHDTVPTQHPKKGGTKNMSLEEYLKKRRDGHE